MKSAMVRVIGLLALLLASLAWAEPVWVDVRSVEEHQQSHIAGDPRINHTDVVAELPALVPDKSTPVYLYCRSGRRAGVAKQALEKAGYQHVVNAGGIDDARAQRGLK